MKKVIFFSLLFISIVFTISNISAQWLPEVRLTNDPTSSYTSFGNARCIAVNGDVVHLVWYDGVTVGEGTWKIFYKRSIDKGVTWSDNKNLTNDGIIAYNPAIAVLGSVVHVVWYDNRNGPGNYQIFYKRSLDNGVTWGADVQLSKTIDRVGHTSIVASGLNVNVVWSEGVDYSIGNNWEIYYKRSIDGGTSWGADTRLSNTASSSYMPAVAVSGSLVHVVWYDDTEGNWEIYYKRSVDGGINWGADKRLTNNSAISQNPALAVSGSVVHIVWVDTRNGNYEIYYNRSNNGGIKWGKDKRLTKNLYLSDIPSIAVTGSVLHIVWHDFRDGNAEIYYKLSSNGGRKWGADTRLTNDPDVSSVPSIAVSGSDIHVIFRDWRDGNSEIYYKRYINTPKGNPTGITNTNPEIPNEYSLSQNYPNPFNPSTAIKFDIPKHGFVSVKIFDELGREIATLVNESLSPGRYEATFDASKYSSGVYFYKLEAGDFGETKRMMLIQ